VQGTRVYVDTSVFGGILDEEFAVATGRFFERAHRGEFSLIVSTSVMLELRSAPQPVRDEFERISGITELPVSPEVERLADAYLAAGVLGTASRADALHVAAATVAGADLIVSWNFKHIVNYNRIRKYNAVNALNGYRSIEIRSPAEVAYDDQSEDV
jgi:predicted nucleic acid-binding protein